MLRPFVTLITLLQAQLEHPIRSLAARTIPSP